MQEVELVPAEGTDMQAPGAAVTVALCGRWEHDPPCPLAAHQVQTEQREDRLHVRVLFATEPENEDDVRRRIVDALSGRCPLPEGLAVTWQARDSRRGHISAADADRARRLVSG